MSENDESEISRILLNLDRDKHGKKKDVVYIKAPPLQNERKPITPPLDTTTRHYIHARSARQTAKRQQPITYTYTCPKCGLTWETMWHLSRPTIDQLKAERDNQLKQHAPECTRTFRSYAPNPR